MDVVVGRVAKAHGIRGEVGVDIRTDEPERRFAQQAVVRAAGQNLTVKTSRRHQGRLLIVFEEITDRTAAEALQGSELTASINEDVRPEAPDEFYDRHLIGLTVRDSHGNDRGQVGAVEHLPAQDLLLVTTTTGDVRIPFVEALVPEINLDEGFLVVADVPGLLNPDEADNAH